jgi:acyl carrier protein
MNTLTTGDIITRIKTLVGNKAGRSLDEIHDNAKLSNDLGLDSLDHVELIMELEREFGIAITDSQAERCTTINDISKLIIAELGAEICENAISVERFLDYWGQPLAVGDDITYVGARGHTPYFQEGKIVAFDDTRKYRDCVQVLGEKNSRPGWTYASRIIKKVNIC